MKHITVIGLGLIGGSLALDLKKKFNCTIDGIDKNQDHINKALDIGLIDKEGDITNLSKSDVVIIATPVDKISNTVLKVLDTIKEDSLVFDVGSVKNEICISVKNHPKRKNYLAAHPIAGTEFSGPTAAIYNLFDGKVNILCEAHKTDWKILDTALSLFKSLNMRIKMMDPEEHDRHIAYVSHLSHVSSFMLGKTVLEIEKDEQSIFDMAGSGFESTVRLAKSSPATWTPIFIQNKENLLKSLKQYIKNLEEFKTFVENENTEALLQNLESTNYIKEVLKGINQPTKK